VHVVERSPLLGGMAASTDVAGQRVDFGSHRLHPAIAPHLLRELQSLIGDDLQLRERNGRLRLRDRWVRFPLRAGDLVGHLPPALAMRAAAGAALRPVRRAQADSYAEVVRRRFGAAVLDEFYGPYARKLWGTEPDDLAGEMARRRIATTGARSLARRIAQRDGGPNRTFWYPRHGYGQIVDAIAQAAVDAGATIDVATSIRSIDARANGVAVGLDDGRTIVSARVLWTAPLSSLVDVVPAAPASVRDCCNALRHRAMVLVYGVVERPQYTTFDAHYLPDERTAISRLSEPKNYRDGPDPRDRTVLCAEIPCWEGDAQWRASDDELARTVVECAGLVDLPPLALSAIEVRRLARVYPVYTRHALAALETVLTWVANLPNVVVFGRQALFVQDNLHHVMAMGWDAGELAGRAVWDDAAWADANRRYAGNVVDD
jgi:protoporphyrinogen oxidase